jgi:hypothetical protein
MILPRDLYCAMARLLCILLMALLPACAARRSADAEPADILIPAGQYAAAFDAARQSLADLGFELERIDARLGIITTRPKPSAGLATPWDQTQSVPAQEFEELVNRHFRRATITFRTTGEPEHLAGASQTAPGPEPLDLRLVNTPIAGRVEVALERLHRPGWRLEPTVMRWSMRTLDPDLRGTGMWPSYTVAFSQDPYLARRIEARIRAALEHASPDESAP